MSEIYRCDHCDCELENENDIYMVDGEMYCEDCYNEHTFSCDCCGGRFLVNDAVSDENTMICQSCYDNYYRRCECCSALVHDNDVYWRGDYPYCSDCYDDDDEDSFIHDYGYKPEPIFYKCRDEDKIRYYGVELEIDNGGKDDENAHHIAHRAFELSGGLCEVVDSYLRGDVSAVDIIELAVGKISGEVVLIEVEGLVEVPDIHKHSKSARVVVDIADSELVLLVAEFLVESYLVALFEPVFIRISR